ncbi:MAG: efflux RND transporter periplasmic adaptor subunit [Rhodothermales bacterium]
MNCQSRSRNWLVVAILSAGIAVGCGNDTDPATAADDHEEEGGGAVTIWTDQSELFFEYPAMVAGRQSGAWAVHLTRLDDFSPITDGTLTLTFRAADGTAHETIVEAPTRPGIYGPRPTVEQAGLYHVAMTIAGSQLNDSYDIGTVPVYAAVEEIEPSPEEAGGGISFLKEQQWPIEFAVVRVEERDIARTLDVTGEIVPAAGRVADVASPVSGLALVKSNLNALAPGQRVREGQTLVTLSPTVQDNSFAEARANVERLTREVRRAERLYAAEAIPERRLTETKHDLDVARSAFTALGGTVAEGYDFPITAPIAGVIQERGFNPGARVEAGQILYNIVDPGVVWLRLRIPSLHAAEVNGARASSFTVEGSDRRYRARNLVSIGSVIDPLNRTLPVTMAVDNPDGSLKIGMLALAQLELGGNVNGLAVPNAAIMNEDGAAVAYVQVGGESFERRQLVVGPSDGAFTIVEKGLSAGEHVVIEGGYQVYLATLSTSDIGEGHTH